MSKEQFIAACRGQRVGDALRHLNGMSGQDIIAFGQMAGGRNIMGWVAEVVNDRQFLTQVIAKLEKEGVLENIKIQHGQDIYGPWPWFNFISRIGAKWAQEDLQPLKDAGFDINLPNSNGARYTEIRVAAFSEDLSVLKHTLNSGADPTLRTQVVINQTPAGEQLIVLACAAPNTGPAMLLLDRDDVQCHINDTNATDQTPIDWAFYYTLNIRGSKDVIIEKMIAVGAEVDHRYPDGRTYFWYLIGRDHTTEAQLEAILKYCDPNILFQGSYPFAQVCAKKNADWAQLILNSPKFNGYTVDATGFSPAAWALSLPGDASLNMLKALRASGVDLSVWRDALGMDLACWAALYGDKNILEYLYDLGVPLNNMTNQCRVQNKEGVMVDIEEGLRPMHIAAKFGKHVASKFLCDNGYAGDLTSEVGGMQRTADAFAQNAKAQDYIKSKAPAAAAVNAINAKDDNGKTPFARACAVSKDAIEQAIGTDGFDATVTTGAGKSTLHSLIESPVSFSAPDDDSIFDDDALERADDAQEVLVERLVAMKANVNHRDNLGQTPLVDAVKNAKAGVMRKLLELKANPLVPNNNNNTALDIALGSKQLDSVKALLNALGVDNISIDQEVSIKQLNYDLWDDAGLADQLAGLNPDADASYHHGAAAGGAGF